MGREPQGEACSGEDERMLETVESLLIGLFRFIGWRRGLALAPPVTPEVAGSSPVAPVDSFALQN